MMRESGDLTRGGHFCTLAPPPPPNQIGLKQVSYILFYAFYYSQYFDMYESETQQLIQLSESQDEYKNALLEYFISQRNG